MGGVEIYPRRRQAFEADGKHYGAGTFVIPMTQVFARYAKDMLEKQTYPEVRRAPNAPPEPPYDVTAWSLGMLLGVDTSWFVKARSPATSSDRRSVDGALPQMAGRGHRQRIALRVRLQGAGHGDRDQSSAEGRRARRVRRPVARRRHRRRARQDRAGREGLRPERQGVRRAQNRVQPGTWNRRTRNVEPRPCNFTRRASAMYQPWTGGNMDEGWTRWVLEQYEFNLHADSQRRHPRRQAAPEVRRDHPRRIRIRASIVDGYDAPAIRPEYRGGIGEKGLDSLKQFVADGGTLVTMGNACDLAIEQLPIPVRDLKKGLDARSALRAGRDPPARGRHAASRSATASRPTRSASTSTARSSS